MTTGAVARVAVMTTIGAEAKAAEMETLGAAALRRRTPHLLASAGQHRHGREEPRAREAEMKLRRAALRSRDDAKSPDRRLQPQAQRTCSGERRGRRRRRRLHHSDGWQEEEGR